MDKLLFHILSCIEGNNLCVCVCFFWGGGGLAEFFVWNCGRVVGPGSHPLYCLVHKAIASYWNNSSDFIWLLLKIIKWCILFDFDVEMKILDQPNVLEQYCHSFTTSAQQIWTHIQLFVLQTSRNILKHILHKWGGHIWPFHDDWGPKNVDFYTLRAKTQFF